MINTGNSISSNSYVKNAQGCKETNKNFNNVFDNNIAPRTEIEYGKNGEYTITEYSGGIGGTTKKTTYNESGKILKESVVSCGGRNNKETSYEYDESGNFKSKNVREYELGELVYEEYNEIDPDNIFYATA